MKHLMTSVTAVYALLFISACSHAPTETATPTASTPAAARDVAAKAAGCLLKYDNAVSLSDFEGTTFYSLMDKTIKPALDKVAQKGFKVASGTDVDSAIDNLDDKVSASGISGAGTREDLVKLANKLSKGPAITFYDLPNAIEKTKIGDDKFGLATFLGLASGGGVSVQIDGRNCYYNVNYGTGKVAKDPQTGRSFGEAPGHKASDASDRFYLQELEDLVRAGKDNSAFYTAILQVLTASDVSGYAKLSKDPTAQTVATDFFTIYTAEQDRHMMPGPAWDEALLEVTLLGAFHGGQDTLKVMFDGELTDTTLKQARCAKATVKKKASLIDYWQFSKNITDPKNCKRSGINITRDQFRNLGAAISAYMRKKNEALVNKVEAHFKGVTTGGNVFAELSSYLINAKTPAKLGANGTGLVEDYVEFLSETAKEAKKISTFVIEEWKGAAK